MATIPLKQSPEKEARPTALAGLKITERPYSSYQGTEWDAFARDSSGSFLGSWRVITARRLFGAVRFFDFILSDGSSAHHKIGQCALLIGAQSVTFLDRIHLISAQTDQRDQCLALVVQKFGDRNYYYGSQWNEKEYFP